MTIYGWDMSNWDNPQIGDAPQEGFAFITHKAGGDTSSGDQELGAWWPAARATDPAKVLIGTYWVPRPDMYADPVSEASRWLARLDSQCPGWRGRPHMLQIDAEEWNQDPATKPSPWYIRTLAARLVALMPKLRPIVYASAGQYGGSLAGLGYPLWNANYPSSMAGTAYAIYQHVGGDSGPGWDSYSGQTPAIWQFTSSATIAGQTTCDANAYRGTLAQLVSLVAPGWEVPDMLGTDTYNDYGHPTRTVDQRLADDAAWRDWFYGDPAGVTNGPSPFPNSPMVQLQSLLKAFPQVVADLAAVKQATAALQAAPPVQVTQEQLTAAFVAAFEQMATKPSAGA